MMSKCFVLLLLSLLGLYGCGAPERDTSDVTPPVTTVVPASGIYPQPPAAVALTSESGATIYYRWNDASSKKRYTDPIAFPDTDASSHTLWVWAEDAAGNRETPRREHYVLDPEVPPVELLDFNDAHTLRWRSPVANATYTISVTSSGWGTGKTLATGTVTPNQEQQVALQGKAFYDGDNRLWLRVTDDAGHTGAISRRFRVHHQTAHTQVSPPGGLFGQSQIVSMRTGRPATIYYTTDGSTPSPATGKAYSKPFTLKESTTLSFMSEDADGNQEPVRQTQFDIKANAATLALITPLPSEISGAFPLAVKWQSDRDGSYEIILQHQYEDWQRTIQQGSVTTNKPVESVIASHFLSPGDWFIELKVRPDDGAPGSLRLPIRIVFRDTFESLNFIDAEATTASLQTAQQHVALPLGPRSRAMYRTRGRSRYVKIRESRAYVANGRAGLQIVDVSDPAAPKRVGAFYPHGKAKALDFHQGYVYLAASGSKVVIFDVSNPEQPIPVSSTLVRGAASSIQIVPPYAYVGSNNGTLTILDLTEPLRPRRVSTLDVSGPIIDLAIHNGMVYLANLDRGLAIIDATDPQQPRKVHQWSTQQAATGVATDGTHVFVAADKLEVLDVTDPTAPSRKLNHYLQGTYSVALSPPYALAPSGTNGLQIVRMTQSGLVTKLPSGHYASRIDIAGQMALLADTRGGLLIIELSPSGPPRLQGKLQGIGTIVDAVRDGDLAYLANDDKGSGLVVVDISQPHAPRVIGRYHSESTIDVDVWDRWALLGDTAARLHLLDLQAGPHPRLTHTLTLDQRIHRVITRPPYAFVASDTAGVHVVEILQEGKLQYHSTFRVSNAITDEDEEEILGRAVDIALVGDDAYIAAVEGGIDIIDISDPLQPRRKAGYRHADSKGDHLIRLAATSDRVYAIDNKRGIQILQRAEDGTLTHIHGITVPSGAPWGLTAVGPYLAVTTLLNAMYMYDVSTPTEPRLLSHVPYGGSSVTAKDDMFYIGVRGRRGVPGGLRLVEGFAAVSGKAIEHFKARDITTLPGATPDSRLVPRAYTYHSPSTAISAAVSTAEIDVASARLRVEDYWGASGRIHYALSNNGGEQWHDVEPGVWFLFPQPGWDLRWRVTLETTDVVHTPALEQITIEVATTASAR